MGHPDRGSGVIHDPRPVTTTTTSRRRNPASRASSKASTGKSAGLSQIWTCAPLVGIANYSYTSPVIQQQQQQPQPQPAPPLPTHQVDYHISPRSAAPLHRTQDFHPTTQTNQHSNQLWQYPFEFGASPFFAYNAFPTDFRVPEDNLDPPSQSHLYGAAGQQYYQPAHHLSGDELSFDHLASPAIESNFVMTSPTNASLPSLYSQSTPALIPPKQSRRAPSSNLSSSQHHQTVYHDPTESSSSPSIQTPVLPQGRHSHHGIHSPAILTQGGSFNSSNYQLLDSDTELGGGHAGITGKEYIPQLVLQPKRSSSNLSQGTKRPSSSRSNEVMSLGEAWESSSTSSWPNPNKRPRTKSSTTSMAGHPNNDGYEADRSYSVATTTTSTTSNRTKRPPPPRTGQASSSNIDYRKPPPPPPNLQRAASTSNVVEYMPPRASATSKAAQHASLSRSSSSSASLLPQALLSHGISQEEYEKAKNQLIGFLKSKGTSSLLSWEGTGTKPGVSASEDGHVESSTASRGVSPMVHNPPPVSHSSNAASSNPHQQQANQPVQRKQNPNRPSVSISRSQSFSGPVPSASDASAALAKLQSFAAAALLQGQQKPSSSSGETGSGPAATQGGNGRRKERAGSVQPAGVSKVPSRPASSLGQQTKSASFSNGLLGLSPGLGNGEGLPTPMTDSNMKSENSPSPSPMYSARYASPRLSGTLDDREVFIVEDGIEGASGLGGRRAVKARPSLEDIVEKSSARRRKEKEERRKGLERRWMDYEEVSQDAPGAADPFVQSQVDTMDQSGPSQLKVDRGQLLRSTSGLMDSMTENASSRGAGGNTMKPAHTHQTGLNSESQPSRQSTPPPPPTRPTSSSKAAEDESAAAPVGLGLGLDLPFELLSSSQRKGLSNSDSGASEALQAFLDTPEMLLTPGNGRLKGVMERFLDTSAKPDQSGNVSPRSLIDLLAPTEGVVPAKERTRLSVTPKVEVKSAMVATREAKGSNVLLSDSMGGKDPSHVVSKLTGQQPKQIDIPVSPIADQAFDSPGSFFRSSAFGSSPASSRRKNSQMDSGSSKRSASFKPWTSNELSKGQWSATNSQAHATSPSPPASDGRTPNACPDSPSDRLTHSSSTSSSRGGQKSTNPISSPCQPLSAPDYPGGRPAFRISGFDSRMTQSSPPQSRSHQAKRKGPVPSVDPNAKPLFSYAALIGQAILSTAQKKMSLSEIYNYIMANYPFYKKGDAGWQNSIRHNLSLNTCFIKLARDPDTPGKGCLWSIDPATEDQFANGGFVKRGGSISKKVKVSGGSVSSGHGPASEPAAGGRSRIAASSPVPSLDRSEAATLKYESNEPKDPVKSVEQRESPAKKARVDTGPADRPADEDRLPAKTVSKSSQAVATLPKVPPASPSPAPTAAQSRPPARSSSSTREDKLSTPALAKLSPTLFPLGGPFGLNASTSGLMPALGQDRNISSSTSNGVEQKKKKRPHSVMMSPSVMIHNLSPISSIRSNLTSRTSPGRTKHDDDEPKTGPTSKDVAAESENVVPKSMPFHLDDPGYVPQTPPRAQRRSGTSSPIKTGLLGSATSRALQSLMSPSTFLFGTPGRYLGSPAGTYTSYAHDPYDYDGLVQAELDSLGAAAKAQDAQSTVTRPHRPLSYPSPFGMTPKYGSGSPW